MLGEKPKGEIKTGKQKEGKRAGRELETLKKMVKKKKKCMLTCNHVKNFALDITTF